MQVFAQNQLVDVGQGQTTATPTMIPRENANQPGILSGIAGTLSWVLTLGNPVHLDHPRIGFSPAQKPEFLLSIPSQDQANIGKLKQHVWQTKDENIQASIVSSDGNTTIPAVIKKNEAGQFAVTVQNTTGMPHGDYHLQVNAKETFIYTRDLSQDFSWGVIAVNTNKSIYSRGEKAHLMFGVVDKDGNTVCNAQVTVDIGDPSGKHTTLSTKDGTIQHNADCSGSSVTYQGDYYADYKTSDTGQYGLHVVATTRFGSHSLDDYFWVKDNQPFVVERSHAATRIYPAAAYEMVLTITANQDYHGMVKDMVPKAFKVTDISNNGTVPDAPAYPLTTPSASVLAEDASAYANLAKRSELLYENIAAHKIDHTPMPIVWSVDWKKNHTYKLAYTLHYPPVSPEFLLVGPLQVGENNPLFVEQRQWQIASDATQCWVGSAGANWSAASGVSWQTTAGAGSTLGSADAATFDPAKVVCTSATTTNTDSSIDSGFGGTVDSVAIKSAYTHTITQNVALIVTTSYNQAAGTFTGGSQSITMSGTFTLSGGTFTSTSGTLTAHNTWNTTGGTFAANGGTVAFSLDSSYTITGSSTFNNLKYGNAVCNNVFVNNIASGTTLTVNGTLTLNQGCFPGSMNGPGNMIANGDISVAQKGIRGSAVITISGTGSQAFSGDGVGGNSNFVPSITINKSSGTLSFSNTIVANSLGSANSWTYTQGTLSMGTSTIVMLPGDGSTLTMTGSMTFYNLDLGNGGCPGTGAVVQIASGTTETASNTLTMHVSTGCFGLPVNGPGSLVAQGDLTVSQDGVTGNIALTLSGSANQTITGSGIHFSTGNVTINKSGGTATLATGLSLNGSGQTLTLSGGTLDLAGFNLNVNSTFTINGNATLKLQGAELNPTVYPNISVGGTSTVNYYGTGTYNHLIVGTNYYNLTFSAAGSWTDATASAVLGNFTQSAGTFTAPSGNLTIGGNFARSGGTFTHNNGTVIFNDSTQTTTLSSSTTFYNLSSTTSNKILIFTASTTQTVSNTLTLTGSVNNYIRLKSSSGGTAANLTVNGTSAVIDVRVSDSNACGGKSITDTSGGDAGGNSCWTFSGIVKVVNGCPASSTAESVTFDHTKLTADQASFPALVAETSDTTLKNKAKSDGTDIFFVNTSGTNLNYEIDKYTSSTGEIEAWVQIATLSSSADTVIDMCFGDGTTHTTPASPWDSNYKEVLHLKDLGTTSLTDSSQSPNNATKSTSTDPAAGTGLIDGGQLLTRGSAHYVQIPFASKLPTGDFTFSTWAKNTDFTVDTANQTFFNAHNKAVANVNTNGTVAVFMPLGGSYTSTTALSTGTWNYIVITRSGTTWKTYLNSGTAESNTGSDSTALDYGTSCQIDVGADVSSCNDTDGGVISGTMDEFRVSNIARSSSWIAAEYNNQNSPSTFETFALLGAAGQHSVEYIRVKGGVKINGGTTLRNN